MSMERIQEENEESEKLMGSSFKSLDESFEDIEKTSRVGFIRKVYCLLSFQVAVVVAVVFFALYVERLKEFIQANSFLCYIQGCITFISSLSLVCFVDFQRKIPYNYITFMLYTLSQAYIIAYKSSFYRWQSVLLAGVLTLGVVLALSLYTFYIKEDYTTKGALLFVCLMALLVVSILQHWLHFQPIQIISNLISIMLFSAYLIYDTQLLLGEKSVKFSTDDYISATIFIFVDIVQLLIEALLGTHPDVCLGVQMGNFLG